MLPRTAIELLIVCSEERCKLSCLHLREPCPVSQETRRYAIARLVTGWVKSASLTESTRTCIACRNTCSFIFINLGDEDSEYFMRT